MVLLIKSKDELTEQLGEAGDKLVVIDFFATWCGPCKVISPKFEEFSNEHNNIVFLKVDVDECEDVATEYNISSMPTFLFIKNKVVIDTLIGASVDKLKEKLQKHQ